jgi:hypothetical protein
MIYSYLRFLLSARFFGLSISSGIGSLSRSSLKNMHLQTTGIPVLASTPIQPLP